MKVANSLLELTTKCEKMAIEMKESALKPLTNLLYSQVESPKFEPFAMQCRGMVIDGETLEILGRPFTRFFNFGEGRMELKVLENQTKLDDVSSLKKLNELYRKFESGDQKILNELSYYEKVDGSLIKVYFYPKIKKWLVGTKGQAVCESANGRNQLSFYDLFLQSLNLENDSEFQNLMEITGNRNNTYLFEITSRKNTVVVQHKETGLWFLGAVDNETGLVVEESIEHDFSNIYQSMPNVKEILKPKKYSFESIKEAEIFSKNLPFDDEGYVIYYQKQPIFKIKSPAYVQAHHMLGNGGIFKETSTIKLVFLNELSEYLTYFANYADKMLIYQIAKEQMVKDILKGFLESYQFNMDRKAYAAMIEKEDFKGIFFHLKTDLDNELTKNENLNTEEKELILTHKIEQYLNKLSDKSAYNLLTNYMDKNGFARGLI